MAVDLAHQRCYNHARREAVALCPECRRYFCRECVTEHEDRVLCASCLGRISEDAKRRGRIEAGFHLLQWLAGLVVVWLFFYVVGQGLLALPSSFHEGTVWRIDDGAEE